MKKEQDSACSNFYVFIRSYIKASFSLLFMPPDKGGGMEINMNQVTNDIIYLLACALHKQIPNRERVQAMNLTQLYHASQFHALSAMIALTLESSDVLADEENKEIAKKWKYAKEMALFKNLSMNAERGKIINFLETHGIWYLPLKGIVLQELYPQFGMREMADNDILYDASYQMEVCRFMEERGYEAVSVGKSNHDIYHKKPTYNFELHTSLFDEKNFPSWAKYYRNVKTRLCKDEHNSYGYHFSDEDFYIFFITHACKHHNGNGTGLRTLLDCYVYLQKKGAHLDWNYIQNELKLLGADTFEEQCRTLSQAMFEKTLQDVTMVLDESKQEILSQFMLSGTYGTIQQNMRNHLKKIQADEKPISSKTKRTYILRRMFPDLDWYKANVPFCYRHRCSIPFYWMYRNVRTLLFRRKSIKCEIKRLHQIN